MRLTIRHETVIRYALPANYSIQILRLTPRLDGGQRVLDWTIESPGRRSRHVDAYGNVAHTLVLDGRHDGLRVAVHGTVDIPPLIDGRLLDMRGDAGVALPREMFLMPTRLTPIDDAVRAFAAQAMPQGIRDSRDALKLAQTIRERVAHESGVADTANPASHALESGRGVCQDHAHLFLAACRAQFVPARFVSGYIHPGDTGNVASHAWVDVWFPDSGWVSIDVTHGGFASEGHCRVAIGRDYESASPMRGMRSGNDNDKTEVKVSVGVDDAAWMPFAQ